VGDFLQRYDRLVQARVLARPGGRDHFARGDSDCYLADGGAQCSWTVVAVVDGEALFDITIHNGATRRDRVSWTPSQPRPGGNALISELFAAEGEAEVWARERHRLDLWDWIPGAPRAAAGPGTQVTVRPHDELDGAWLVETPQGPFVWMPVNGRNLVTCASGTLPGRDYLDALFVRAPEIGS